MRGGEARARSASLVALVLIGACSSDDVAPSVTPDASIDASIADASVDADPGATEPVAIATSPGKDEDPSILRAIDGTFHLVFYSNRDGNDRIWRTTSKDGLHGTRRRRSPIRASRVPSVPPAKDLDIWARQL